MQERDRQAGRSAWREMLLATVLGATAALAALLQLFLGPDIGLADNGDGFRLMCEFELLKGQEVVADQLVVRYDPFPAGCDESLRYFSSQQLFVAPAVEAYSLRYGGQAGFDLRTLGVVHSLIFGAALALLYLALPGSRRCRAVTVGAAGLLLADVSFVTYFVSPFSEPATFLGLLLVLAAAAWYVRTSRRLPLALLAVTAAGLFLGVAKSQTIVFALLLVPVILLRTVPVRRMSGPWTGRILPALAAVVMVGVTGANLLQQPAFFSRVNTHNLTFQTLLPEASDPAGALRELGLPASLTRYQDIGYFDDEAEGKLSDPDYQVFRREVSRGDLLGFIGRNPGYWAPMLREGVHAAATVRVHYLSNYREPRPPDEFLAPRPDPARRLLSGLGPAAWPLLPLGWVLVAVAAAAVALRRGADPDRRSTAVVCYLLAAGALSQVVVALLGDGYYELVKHTVLAGYATAVLIAVAIGGAVSAASRWAGQRRQALPADERETGGEEAARGGITAGAPAPLDVAVGAVQPGPVPARPSTKPPGGSQ